MAYRFLIVNTDYEHFLKKLYRDNPGLEKKSYAEQYAVRMETLFGVNDFYSKNLRKLGHEAIDLLCNNAYLQCSWAVENGLLSPERVNNNLVLSDELLAVLFQAQVKVYKPDVIVNLAMETVTSDVLKPLKKDVPLIIGQHAAAISPNMAELSAYDLIVSSLPNLVEYFRQKGVKSEYFKLGFEPAILEQVQVPAERPIDISFVGGFAGVHLIGKDVFNYLADQGFNMALYGYSEGTLSPKAKRFFHRPVYGSDMYKIYADSKIVINRHSKVAEEYANNMRLYEATGMGAMLLNDGGKNLGEIFDIGHEVAAYRSKEECAELVRYYLEHEQERKQIASNGQKRTLSEHSYYRRMSELAEIVNGYLGRTKILINESSNSKRTEETTVINISPNNVLADFRRLKESASRNKYGNWQVRWGDITIYCRDLLSFYMAAKDIFLHRIYDFEACSDNPVVIDGGGYLGLFTIYIKRKYPNARVTVFEPDRESLKLLYKNLKANSINDVKVVEAGLFKENSEMPFSSNNLEGSSIFYNEKNSVVPVVRLSGYIGSGIDFLKLNIEGAELDVLEEIKPHLGKVKELVIEYHGFPETGQRLHQILSILDEAGFKYMLHDFDTESNPSSKPPFRLHEKSRYFLLIYAKKMFSPSVTFGVKSNSIKSGLLVEPVSRKFGFDRGMPIDRYYIEKFLNSNRQSIRGRVMEIADNSYTLKFGSGVTQSEILNTVKATTTTIVGDLTDEATVPHEAFDCIILTQTLQFIYDFRTALKTAMKALKPGGTLLLTVSGISQISRYDMDRWGEYWRFTDKCLKRLLSEYVPEEAVSVEAWGNVAAAKAFLDGFAAEELDKETLEHRDNDYQVVLTARVCKPLIQQIGISNRVTLSGHEPVLKSPLVLLYHRIADDELDSQLLAVSPKNFEGHLRELKERYRVISLHELVQEIRRGQLNPGTVAITFDDGYLDVLTDGVPLLEKYELPATVFITSGMVGSDEEFWWDVMESIFLTGRKLPGSLSIKDSQGVLNWSLGSAEERLRACNELCVMLRQLAVSRINEIVGQLFLWAGIKSSARMSHRVVSAEQLRKLSMSGVIEIGSHTVSHTKLSVLSPQEQRREIEVSKQQLESIIQKPVWLISYPYGTSDSFAKETADIVADAGYIAGIANIQGNVINPVDIYAVPRRLVRNWPPDLFARWLRDDNKGSLEAETISKRAEKIIKYQLRHEPDLIKVK